MTNATSESNLLNRFPNPRYQVVNVLGKKAGQQTYLALDTQCPDSPQCVIKGWDVGDRTSSQVIIEETRVQNHQWSPTLKAHTQIAQWRDAGASPDLNYVIRDYVVGQSLAQIQHLCRPWTEVAVWDFLHEVLGLLEIIHQEGLVHGHLHPGNIIRRRTDHKLVITELGAIASLSLPNAEDPSPDSTSIPVNKSSYFAQEQYQGNTCEQSDLYAVGIMGIELLTGCRYWQRSDASPISLLQQMPAVRQSKLIAVLTHLVQPNVGDRIPTAAAALLLIQDHAPRANAQNQTASTTAPPPSTGSSPTHAHAFPSPQSQQSQFSTAALSSQSSSSTTVDTPSGTGTHNQTQSSSLSESITEAHHALSIRSPDEISHDSHDLSPVSSLANPLDVGIDSTDAAQSNPQKNEHSTLQLTAQSAETALALQLTTQDSTLNIHTESKPLILTKRPVPPPPPPLSPSLRASMDDDSYEGIEADLHESMLSLDDETENEDDFALPSSNATQTLQKTLKYQLSAIPPSRVFNGTVAGVALSIALGLTVYSYGWLLYPHLLNKGLLDQTTLDQAQDRYHQGQLQEAIRMAQTIAPESEVYRQAQAAIAQWQEDWDVAVNQFSEMNTAFDNQQWTTVLQQSESMPDNEFWQAQVATFVQQAQAEIDAQHQDLLQRAFDRALERDFALAVAHLEQIPSEVSFYDQVTTKMAEYIEKREVRARYFLQQAFDFAASANFTDALANLRQIPPEADLYEVAQEKIVEYTESQQIRASHLLQQAYEQASVEDYATAITYLQEIPSDVPFFGLAQQKILEYGDSYLERTESAEVVIPTPETPSATPSSESLNPGDRLQEAIPKSE